MEQQPEIKKAEPVTKFKGPKPIRIVQKIQPYEDRSKTDVCCCVIGIIFTLAVISSAFVLRKPAHMYQITQPSDSKGKVCGWDYPHLPYLSFPNSPLLVCSCVMQTGRVCVARCPSNTNARSSINGKLCLPKSKGILGKLSIEDRTSSRYMFFLEFDRFYLILAASLVLSILFYALMRCCPGNMMHLTFFLSAIFEIILGAVFYLYTKQALVGKIIISVIMLITFLLSIMQIMVFRQSLRMNKIFLAEGKRFISAKRGVFWYIPLFMIITSCFLYLMYWLYLNSLSIMTPHQTPNNIYYDPNHTGFLIAIPILCIYLIWGLACIKQAFSFVINAHVIHYCYQAEGSAFCFALRLAFKHLGSIFAAAFINSFFLVPSTIYDSFRNCGDAKFQKVNCCNSLFDIVRNDAISMVILTGTPYCNAAKYCEYFWYESMTTEKTSSSLRIYKIAAHVLITVLSTIAGLFYLGLIEGSIVYFDLIGGMVISTFFISLPIDVTDTLRLLYLMEEEGYKRREDFIKYSNSILSKTDQQQFVRDATRIFSNEEVAKELAKLRRENWKITEESEGEDKEKKKKKKKKKGEGKK